MIYPSETRTERSIFLCSLLIVITTWGTACSAELEIATFQVDATPPAGSPLCNALVPPATGVADPLSARGVVVLPVHEKPIVLVAIDWVGIGNSGHDAWRGALAEAAQTIPERVYVHSLHQHDAPGCDFSAEELAAEHGLAGQMFPVKFARETIARAADAVTEAMTVRRRVTHIGTGRAKVEKVASNRRLLGPDGKVDAVRFTATADPAIRARPEGTIDPWVKLVSFWDEAQPVAVLSYYATHPQSYYRTGLVSADFVGLARSMCEEQLPNAPLTHFNGAGGNIGAGKYNDGSPENRPKLAQRLSQGMQLAWESTERAPIEDMQIDFQVRLVHLPPAPWLTESECLATLKDEKEATVRRLTAARDLTWLRRRARQRGIQVSRLRIGNVDLVHLPGELFVEYQLAAQRLRPDNFVCVAAYGDYGPGYIGLAESYPQGGYETGRVSRVSPRVETVLINAIGELMQ